jgi:hypothetical protein
MNTQALFDKLMAAAPGVLHMGYKAEFYGLVQLGKAAGVRVRVWPEVVSDPDGLTYFYREA